MLPAEVEATTELGLINSVVWSSIVIVLVWAITEIGHIIHVERSYCVPSRYQTVTHWTCFALTILGLYMIPSSKKNM